MAFRRFGLLLFWTSGGPMFVDWTRRRPSFGGVMDTFSCR